jgi:hypothetical protein
VVDVARLGGGRGAVLLEAKHTVLVVLVEDGFMLQRGIRTYGMVSLEALMVVLGLDGEIARL